VARVCLAIAANKQDARRLTVKRNSIAVITDGSAVLGLGNIGPEAALPVMEGKAALFKRFADIDAWPLCLDTQDVDEIVTVVKAVAPGFAGINLEDISAPRCFEIEARLRELLDIPVFHDDQHGTAGRPARPSSSSCWPRGSGTWLLPTSSASCTAVVRASPVSSPGWRRTPTPTGSQAP